MQTGHIAKYAPQARTDFIAAVTKQALKYGKFGDLLAHVKAITGKNPK